MSNTCRLDPKIWGRLAIFVIHDPERNPMARQLDIAVAMSNASLPSLDYFNNSRVELRLQFWEDEFEKLVRTLPPYTRKPRYEVDYYYSGLNAMAEYIGLPVDPAYEYMPQSMRTVYWTNVLAKATQCVQPQLLK